MKQQALFAGLIYDENDNPVEITYIGEEACYVVNDSGFRRHIPAREVDQQVVRMMLDQVKGHEDILTEQAARMMGQEDIFTRAIIQSQIKNIDQQIETLFQTGIPEEGRAYLGMMGFRIIINLHGEIVKVEQPGIIPDEGGE